MFSTHLICLIDILVRLAGGSSYNEGRVELYYNTQWGTVCDDGWDDTDAGVVCRQLGFGSSGRAIGSAGFNEQSGPALLDSVLCTGNEITLTSCGHLGINITRSCTHNGNATVRCGGLQGMLVELWCEYGDTCEVVCQYAYIYYSLSNNMHVVVRIC